MIKITKYVGPRVTRVKIELTKPEPYDWARMDERIISCIGNGRASSVYQSTESVPFEHRLWGSQIEAFVRRAILMHPPPAGRDGRICWRGHVERRLQVLRKTGMIRYSQSRGWEIVR